MAIIAINIALESFSVLSSAILHTHFGHRLHRKQIKVTSFGFVHFTEAKRHQSSIQIIKYLQCIEQTWHNYPQHNTYDDTHLRMSSLVEHIEVPQTCRIIRNSFQIDIIFSSEEWTIRIGNTLNLKLISSLLPIWMRTKQTPISK